jgi:hypothetical protein
MHKKYAKNGLVCMSVSVDLVDDKDKAHKFLKSKGATFANYLLDEEETKVWQDHWDMGGPPAVFVYGRDGKIARRFVNDADNTFTYADVEKYVKTLLPK